MAIEKIVIVGGGTAGWMSAAALIRLKSGTPLDIQLIESEQIGTVGVGEATIPPFVEFNRLLNIDEQALLAAVQGTFKVGIQFENWGKIGDSYIHPFGNYGYEMGGIAFHQVWRKLRQDGDKRPLQAFNLETMAAYFGKFARTADYAREDLPPMNYAYHINATAYAGFLRADAEQRAHRAGWQWQVPLQHRNGNGHVYCSEYMEDDEAHDILVKNMAGKPQAEPNFLRFVTGRRKKFWNKNVVAIGLSAGFMEPLESTSIHLINTGINKLLAVLSLDGITPIQESSYNRLTGKEYARIRDFLILHYNATTRDDSEFWNYCRTMDVPETLTEKIELFRTNGQIFREEDELFTETSWAAVMLGQGIEMEGSSPIASALNPAELKPEIDGMEQSIRYLVQRLPGHGEFVSRYCPAVMT